MKEEKRNRIVNIAYELLKSRDWKVNNEELVTKCFDLSKEFAKQAEEFFSSDN